MILDVKLHYSGSLVLVYYSYNQETYWFFFVVFLAAARFSGKHDRKWAWSIQKWAWSTKIFRALRAHNKKNPPFSISCIRPCNSKLPYFWTTEINLQGMREGYYSLFVCECVSSCYTYLVETGLIDIVTIPLFR